MKKLRRVCIKCNKYFFPIKEMNRDVCSKCSKRGTWLQDIYEKYKNQHDKIQHDRKKEM